MKKVLNKYSVWRNGQCWLSDISDYEGATDVVKYILDGLRFTDDEVELTITRAYVEAGGIPQDELAYIKFKRGYWFKDNRFNIIIKAVATNEVVEMDRFDELDNELLKPIKAFNGKSLRLNTIEPPSKFKLGAFHDPDTWFALSVFRNKGWSTLGRPKKDKGTGDAVEIAAKIAQYPDFSAFNVQSCDADIIRRMVTEGIKPCEIRRQLKSRFKGRSGELRKLINQLA